MILNECMEYPKLQPLFSQLLVATGSKVGQAVPDDAVGKCNINDYDRPRRISGTTGVPLSNGGLDVALPETV